MKNLEIFFGSDIFIWIILPLLIFVARIADVTLGTMRIVFISKELKYLAPLVGFFEVIIWLLAIRQIMQNLNNIACYIAYGAGFAVGTLIGMHIERKMAIGSSIIRIITKKDATELIGHLRSEGYGATSMEAKGSEGKVHVIYMTIRRQDFENIAQIIRKFNPNAFYTVEDVRLVSKGIFPMKRHAFLVSPLRGPFRFWRKGK